MKNLVTANNTNKKLCKNANLETLEVKRNPKADDSHGDL